MRLALPLLLALPACSDSSGPQPVADFALLDVNPASATFGEEVSPRNHLGHVTAWFFGGST